MPEINLLKDTEEGPDSKRLKPKRVPPAPVAFSSPERSDEKGKPLKKPSGLVLWFRSLFARPKKGGKAATVSALPPPPKMKPSALKPLVSPAEAEDIFAGIPAVSGGPAAKKPPVVKPSLATGPQPGDFPALPRIPPKVPLPPQPPSLKSVPPRGAVPARPVVQQPSPPPPRMRIPAAQPLRPQPTAEEEEFSGVNLLPEELVETFDPRQKLITIGLAALATALVIGILSVALLIWKETQVVKTEQKRVEVSETLRKIALLETEQRKAILLKSSNDIIRQLLNRHVYWTSFLDGFERATLPTVFFPGGLTVSVGSGVSLTGIAPDIATITQQLAVYQQATDFIKDIRIDSISRNTTGGGYGFVADFTFLPDVYYQPIDKVTTAGQSGTNTNSTTTR